MANPFRLLLDMDGGRVRFLVENGGRLRITNLLTPGFNLPAFAIGDELLRLDLRARVSQSNVTWLSVDVIDAKVIGQPVSDTIIASVLERMKAEIVARRRLFVEAELVDIHRELHGMDSEISQVQSEIDRRRSKLRKLKRIRDNEVDRLANRSTELRMMLQNMPRAEGAEDPVSEEQDVSSPGM